MNTEAVNRYTLESEIDSGSQGQVVRALDTVTNDAVAIKIFSISSPVGAFGFANEYLIHKLMSGKSNRICTMLDSFQIPNQLGFIVMKKYKQDLYDRVFASEIKLSPKRLKHIFKKICQGVKDLHKAGIAHLDIKPENVLLDENQKVFLCDFGFSYVLDPTKSKLSKRLRKTIHEKLQGRGTKRYAATEVYNAEEFNPFCADIYSLGITLHALLTGFYPTTPNTNDLNLEIAKSKLSRKCFSLLSSMVHSDPSKRPTIEVVLRSEWLNDSKCRKMKNQIAHYASI